MQELPQQQELPVGTQLPVGKLHTLLLAYRSNLLPSLADHSTKPLLLMRGR